MSRGGPRNGAGRKKGSRSRSRVEIASRLAELDCDPIAGLVAISKDEKASIDVKARVLIELAGYCHAKQRPEPQRRRLSIDSALPIEGQARQVIDAMSAGNLAPDDAGAVLQGLGRVAEMQRIGALADIVALLASRMNIPLPAELQLRRKIPEALSQEPGP
jgi:hypothetical protein